MNLYEAFVRQSLSKMEARQKDILGTHIPTIITNADGDMEFLPAPQKTPFAMHMEDLEEIIPSIDAKIKEIKSKKANGGVAGEYYGQMNLLALELLPVPEGCKLTCQDKMKIASTYSQIINKLHTNKEVLFDGVLPEDVTAALKSFYFTATKEVCQAPDLGEYLLIGDSYTIPQDCIDFLQENQNIANNIAGLVIYNDLLEVAGL